MKAMLGSVAAVVFLCGCGGSGGPPPPASAFAGTLSISSLRLENGDRYAQVLLHAAQNGTATVTLASGDFDPLVTVEEVGGGPDSQVVAEDDDGDDGTNARASFGVHAGRTYRVIVTSSDASDAGAFSGTFTRELVLAKQLQMLSDPVANTGFQPPMVNTHYAYRFLDFDAGIPHPGVDYNGDGDGDGDLDEPYCAVARGEVIETNFGTWGSFVIKHVYKGEVVYSQYAHSEPSRVLVEVGQIVEKGEVIGRIGKKGTTTAHLHWEIRRANHPDPENPSYWPDDVLQIPAWEDRLAAITDRYCDPEEWVATHGPYTAVPSLTAVLNSTNAVAHVGVTVANGYDIPLESVNVQRLQLGSIEPTAWTQWSIGDLASTSSRTESFIFAPGLGQKKASLLTATVQCSSGAIRLRTKIRKQ